MLEGKPLFPGKDRKNSFLNFQVFETHGIIDVNQFSIITELLGTPPPDVIETIASENVSSHSGERYTIALKFFIDAAVRTELTETRACPLPGKVYLQRC